MPRHSKWVCIGLLLLSGVAFCAPREIVIIRHGDKWPQSSPGPFLSPKGQLRAEKFVPYFLKTFGQPDFIIATKPGDAKHPDESGSVRPLQTVAPLANQLSHDQKKNYPVQFQFYQKQYAQLAKALLHEKQYQDKLILVCWHHGKINFLAQDLGVKQSLPKWQSNDYDQVYVLKYGKNGAVTSFQILKNQYPVNTNPIWR